MRCLQAALSVTDEVNVSLIHFFADSVNREGHRGKGENGGRLVLVALFFFSNVDLVQTTWAKE